MVRAIWLLLACAGCATPAPSEDWFAAAANTHLDRTADFPAASSILRGFDPPGARDHLCTGDRMPHDIGFSILACMEFMSLIRQTESLRAILERAVVVNLWSVLSNFGAKVSIDFRLDSHELPATRGDDRLRFPLTIRINGEPALDCSVLAAPSASPLNVGAGIVSVVGMRPGEREYTVTMQVLAARRGS